MALRISTTGSDIFLKDLGIIITDPTNNRDLSAEFTSEELKSSDDLTNAIQNGDLVADDGQFDINGPSYDPNELLKQELNLKSDSSFISQNELKAGYKDTPIVNSVFPISLNSTASSTRNVYAPTAKWGTWIISPGDLIEISGSTAADGVYTVESVTDSQNFIVEEAIADSTGGSLSVYHRAATEIIGVDTTNFNTVSGLNLQEVLDSIDDQIGVGGDGGVFLEDEGSSVAGGPHTTLNFTGDRVSVSDQGGGEAQISISGLDATEHRDLDQLVHNLAQDAFKEYVYTGNKVTSIIIWTDSNKTTKIRETQFSFSGNKINSTIQIQYDPSGIEAERLTKTFSYSGNRIVSVDEVLT